MDLDRIEGCYLFQCAGTSVMLYGAAIWASALKVQAYRRKLSRVQHVISLRVACAFRTVSYEAVCAISGMLPIDILAEKRHRI